MKNIITYIATIVFGIVASPYSSLAAAQENMAIESEVISDDDGMILSQSAIISAPIDDVWKAFTTEKGYTSWAVPHAKIDFRVNGIMETSYAQIFTVGSPENIKNQILGYVPNKLLILKNIQAPGGFISPELMEKLVSILEFETIANDKTKITIYGVGYGNDAESKKLINFFYQGNSWSFQQLEKSFATKKK